MGKFFLIGVGLMTALIWSQSSHAYSSSEIETFENEPPAIRPLLEQATDLIAKNPARDATWQAAKLYCEASRLGSAEGLYRLGMLYAFGQGVPENLDYAASLFKASSMHGHFESQKMLETIHLTSTQTPPCIMSAEAMPERNPHLDVILAENQTNHGEAVGIDELIENLPKNKRWLIDLVEKVAQKYEVDPKLVLSIISVESNFKTSALSNKSAQGLMQLIPETAERFNVKNAFDASQNIKGGVAYIRWLLSYFQGDVALAVAAYNAGEGAVNKYKGIPPYRETQKYVKKVQARYPFKSHPYNENVTSPSPAFKTKLNKHMM